MHSGENWNEVLGGLEELFKDNLMTEKVGGTVLLEQQILHIERLFKEKKLLNDGSNSYDKEHNMTSPDPERVAKYKDNYVSPAPKK